MHDHRPEQAECVRERGEAEPRVELLGDRGATDEMAALQDEGSQAGLGQVRTVGQAVVAASDDDGVVLVGCTHVIEVFRSGLKNGSVVTVAGTEVYAWLTVCSTARLVPGTASSGLTRAIPMCACSMGE